MDIIKYIENVYKIWDGTDEHASVCLRFIDLAIHRSKLNILNDVELMEFIKKRDSE